MLICYIENRCSTVSGRDNARLVDPNSGLPPLRETPLFQDAIEDATTAAMLRQHVDVLVVLVHVEDLADVLVADLLELRQEPATTVHQCFGGFQTGEKNPQDLPRIGENTSRIGEIFPIKLRGENTDTYQYGICTELNWP